MDDSLIDRIAAVSNVYRGGHYHLNYCSEEGGNWAYALEPNPQVDDDLPPALAQIFGQATQGAPIFAMRCQHLEVIAEALESWHAKTLVEGI